MKMNKKKTYVLMLSKVFPATHPCTGEPTFFRDKLLAAVMKDGTMWKKLHTIRANWPLWASRIMEVQSGEAMLSVRQWTGKPYKSKQVEITRLGAEDGVGVEMLRFIDGRIIYPTVDGYQPSVKEISQNDGLSKDDWVAWFKDYDLTKPMAIIHFTDYRYSR